MPALLVLVSFGPLQWLARFRAQLRDFLLKEVFFGLGQNQMCGTRFIALDCCYYSSLSVSLYPQCPVGVGHILVYMSQLSVWGRKKLICVFLGSSSLSNH